ncbi:S8 family peptidase [Hyphomonas adhaerens]|uniref:S8 family peptidase n=1 Tax=Hyphomonas adhaerens TaxID=81029 RepID=UPI00235601EA|nr:S8 family peptidase [Hyphomonas adhaerens]
MQLRQQRLRHLKTALVLAVAGPSLAMLGACASGGGGGSSAVTPASPPLLPPPAPPPPPPPPPFPSEIAPPSAFETREYTLTGGLPVIGASAAYSIGATGAGIKVAVIDTGTIDNHPDLQDAFVQTFDVCADTNCSGYDTNGDPITTTRQPDDIDTSGHGTLVSGVIAARRQDDYTTVSDEGTGVQGVAFESSIISVRADSPGSCARTGEDEGCNYNDAALVRAIQYAVDRGASVINMSLGGEIDANPALENAVRSAASAGVLVVISAGNEAEPAIDDGMGNITPAVGGTPTEPAYIAGQDQSLGRVVAVGSIDLNRTISDFSNRAGNDAKSYYILAPGEGVATTGLDDDVVHPEWPACSATVTDQCRDADDTPDYWYATGTSFSAPYMAGALALMLQTFPNLRDKPEVALQILLDTADDYVDPDLDPITGTAAGEGIDEVSGVGILNLIKAFAPQGQQTLDFGTEKVSINAALAPSGGAFGDWASNSGALNGLVFQDGYERGFVLDADAVSSQLPAAMTGNRMVDFATRADWAAGETHSVRAGNLSFNWTQARLYDDPTAPYQEDPESTFQMRYSFGANEVEVGRGGSLTRLAPDVSLLNEPGVGNAFSTGGAWAKFSHHLGQGLVMDFFSAEQRGRSQSGFRFGRDKPRWSYRFGATFVEDANTALGGSVQERFGADDQTRMTAYALEGAWLAGRRWTLSSGMEMASVELPGVNVNDVWTSRWSLGASRPAGPGRLSLIVAQPWRAETGSIALNAPVGIDVSGALIHQTINAGLTPSGRQVDFETRYGFQLVDGWTGETAAVVSTSPNHIAGAEEESALWFRLSTDW